MVEEDRPRRLKRHPDTSAPLAQALLLLQRGRDDTARLARVAAGLGPVLDMPLEAASRIVRRSGPSLAGPRAPRALSRWSACVAGGLAVLAPLLWPTGHEPRSTNVISTPPLEHVAARATPEPEQSAVADRPRAQPSAKRLPARTKRLALQRLAAQTRLPAFEAQPWATKSLDAAPPEPISAAHVATAPSAAPTPNTTAAAAPNAQATPALETESPAVARPVSAAASSSDSESELLLRARQALRSDLERALRLVAEHEARFPKGELVPEREVLAIEALRALGQIAAADARLSQFRTRYPESFYLERLRR